MRSLGNAAWTTFLHAKPLGKLKEVSVFLQEQSTDSRAMSRGEAVTSFRKLTAGAYNSLLLSAEIY